MHDRNHNNNEGGGHKGMLWMMIPCFLLLGFLFLGGGKLSSSGYLWPILIGVFVIAHVWMMFKGHGEHGAGGEQNKSERPAATLAQTGSTLEKQSSLKEGHKHGGGCH